MPVYMCELRIILTYACANYPRTDFFADPFANLSTYRGTDQDTYYGTNRFTYTYSYTISYTRPHAPTHGDTHTSANVLP